MRSKSRSSQAAACAIVLASTLALPVWAQGTGTGSTTGSTESTGSSGLSGSPGSSGSPSGMARSRIGNETDTDGGFDWGWLGLIGLAGLMGVRRSSAAPRLSAPRSGSL